MEHRRKTSIYDSAGDRRQPEIWRMFRAIQTMPGDEMRWRNVAVVGLRRGIHETSTLCGAQLYP